MSMNNRVEQIMAAKWYYRPDTNRIIALDPFGTGRDLRVIQLTGSYDFGAGLDIDKGVAQAIVKQHNESR